MPKLAFKKPREKFVTQRDCDGTCGTVDVPFLHKLIAIKNPIETVENSAFHSPSAGASDGLESTPKIPLILNSITSSQTVFNAAFDMPDAELHKAYPSEYQAWRDMLRRVKDGTRKASRAFMTFRAFLIFRGEKPHPKGKYSLDRIDNDNLEYNARNTRWALRKTQNNNKGDNVRFVCPTTGKVYSPAELAKKHGVAADTIRKRKTRLKWSDAESIMGHRVPTAVPDSKLKLATTLLPTWEEVLGEHYGGATVLTPAGKKMLGQFEDVCREAQVPADKVLTLIIENWSSFTWIVSQDHGLIVTDKSSPLPDVPQPRFLAAYVVTAINLWANENGVKWVNGVAVFPVAEPTMKLPTHVSIEDLASKM